MDAAKKAFLKSRMKEAAQKREKRIESPLVRLIPSLPPTYRKKNRISVYINGICGWLSENIRYNELGKPVCKVCGIAIKSEALWPAHLASRQHKEVNNALSLHWKRDTLCVCRDHAKVSLFLHLLLNVVETHAAS